MEVHALTNEQRRVFWNEETIRELGLLPTLDQTPKFSANADYGHMGYGMTEEDAITDLGDPPESPQCRDCQFWRPYHRGVNWALWLFFWPVRCLKWFWPRVGDVPSGVLSHVLDRCTAEQRHFIELPKAINARLGARNWCIILRKMDFGGSCGPEGRWFKERR